MNLVEAPMARTDDRFEGYNAAPLNHSVVDRGLRLGAGAVTGGASGLVLGVLAVPLVVGAIGAAAVFMAGAPLWGVLAGAVAGAGVGGFFGSTIGGVVGTLYGAFRGASKEHSRAGLDQSLYDIQIAAAQGRGAAQPQPIQYVAAQPVPVAGQPVVARDVADASVDPVRRDTPVVDAARMDNKHPATFNEAAPQTLAGSAIQHDGTIDASRALARL